MTRPAPSGLAPRTRVGFAPGAAAVLVAWFVAGHRTDWTHVVAVVALPGAGETGAGLGEIGRVGVDQGVGACGVGAAFGVSQVLRAGVGERRQARASQQSIRVGAPNTG